MSSAEKSRLYIKTIGIKNRNQRADWQRRQLTASCSSMAVAWKARKPLFFGDEGEFFWLKSVATTAEPLGCHLYVYWLPFGTKFGLQRKYRFRWFLKKNSMSECTRGINRMEFIAAFSVIFLWFLLRSRRFDRSSVIMGTIEWKTDN